MRWAPDRHLPIVAGLALIVAAVGLIAPWWAAQTPGGLETSVSPFDAGQEPRLVDEAAVVAVGVLAFVGLVGLVGGLALGFRRGDPGTASVAGWLWTASGGFLLVAPLTAVVTWPAEGPSFWGTGPVGGTPWEAAASWGWYLTLVAGAMAAIAGMAWVLSHEHEAQAEA